MVESLRRRSHWLVIAILVVALAAAAMLMAGSPTSTILSTVGRPIGGYDQGGAASPDAPAPVSTGTQIGGDGALAAAAVPALLIVRTGTLDLQVTDLTQAIAAADSAVTRAGGYVSASIRAARADDSTAESTYRIPSAGWDTTLAALRAVAGDVKSEEVKTEEVTGQVVDLAARISNLHATEAALQGIMAKATKISDVLDVQGQLTTTRGAIERLVAEKDTLADQAAFGSLRVTFRLPDRPKTTATPTPAKVWDPGTDVANASGKLVRIGQRMTSIGIWLAIVGLPIVIVGAVLLLLGWQVIRLGRSLAARRSGATRANEPLGG